MRRWGWRIVAKASKEWPLVSAVLAFLPMVGLSGLDVWAHAAPWSARSMPVWAGIGIGVVLVGTIVVWLTLVMTMERWLFPRLYPRCVRRLSQRLTRTHAWGKTGATVALSIEQNQVFWHVNATRRRIVVRPKTLALLHWMLVISPDGPFVLHPYTLASVSAGSAHQRLATRLRKP